MIHQMAMSPLAYPASACRRRVAATAMGTFMVTLMVLATTLVAPAQTVVAFVNGEPITVLDVESRMKFTHLSTQKQAARPDVINELIDEKLKIREGKRWGIELTDAEVDSMYANMASRLHQTADQLTQSLQKGGVNPQTLKSQIRANSVWQQLVRGRFASSLQLSEKDIEEALKDKNQSGQSTTATEYTLRPILFLVPPGAQAAIDAKRKEAEALRARFKSCQDGLPAARAIGAVVRDQVIRNSGDLNPELQKVLDAVPVGQLTTPEVTRHGVEMWAICGKQDSKADAPIKKQTREALATKRFEEQSNAYLQRLRKEALIERKQAERTERK
jgi:peptidyl-prolyl cis-trans isomerase SurA